MTPVRAWFARLFGRATPSHPGQTGPSPHQAAPPRGRSRTPRARLELEPLEERTLLSGGTGLTGQYFSDGNFGHLKLTRTDATVNFNWGSDQSPVPGVPGDHFSVRWSGYVQPLYSQTYTFYTNSDDGVKLAVDGQTIINDWTTHSAREDSGSIRLVAGQKYFIQMDYFQNTGAAEAQLMWSSAAQRKEIIPTGQLFPLFSTRPPTIPPPTAGLSAGDVNAAGASSYLFTVTYQDAGGIEVSSLHTGNVRVTGPNGFSALATLVSVSSRENGTPRTATYRITPPGGSWDVNDNGTYTVYLLANQVKGVRGRFAAPTALGSFRVTAPGRDWFDTHLRDAGVRNLARSLDRDHTLSRSDMLAIFREVEAGGVSSAEFADLQTLVANGSALGMPGYVQDLAGKVVDGDPANAHYRGRGLGDLHPGSSGTQLEMLVDKWFLGTDHPIAASSTHYVMAHGSLFGSGPRYADPVQGQLGDCYFLAALSETALRDPSAVRGMFIDNGDGTYTVRFLHDGAPTYVTVDRYLPVTAGGQFYYDGFQASAGSSANKLWVALAEKAYAQLAESGWSRPSSVANSYDALSAGWEGEVFHEVTGKVAMNQTIVNSAASRDALVNAFRSGQLVALDTNPSTSPDIVPDHAYAMVGYNASTETFSLYNPWGSVQQVSWWKVAANFERWTQTIG